MPLPIETKVEYDEDYDETRATGREMCAANVTCATSSGAHSRSEHPSGLWFSEFFCESAKNRYANRFEYEKSFDRWQGLVKTKGVFYLFASINAVSINRAWTDPATLLNINREAQCCRKCYKKLTGIEQWIDFLDADDG